MIIARSNASDLASMLSTLLAIPAHEDGSALSTSGRAVFALGMRCDEASQRRSIMARKRDEAWHTMNPTESAEDVARLLEKSVQRELAERAHQLRLLEAAARCGALFSGSEGANWGIA